MIVYRWHITSKSEFPSLRLVVIFPELRPRLLRRKEDLSCAFSASVSYCGNIFNSLQCNIMITLNFSCSITLKSMYMNTSTSPFQEWRYEQMWQAWVPVTSKVFLDQWNEKLSQFPPPPREYFWEEGQFSDFNFSVNTHVCTDAPHHEYSPV